jgi:predicted lipoprotein with Yx(FWY)xxD motif
MRTALAIPALAACGLAACGTDMEKAAVTQKPAAVKKKAAPAPAKKGKTTYVKVRKTDYGRILTDGKGRALYLFAKEKTRKAECYGACAKAWPVFYGRGLVKAAKGVEQTKLATTRRRGGGRQVTYNGHPLYYYVTDTAPGQVTCQNVDEFGGKWLVVAPSGKAIL